MGHPDSTRTEAPALGTLPDLALCSPSSGRSPGSFVIPFTTNWDSEVSLPESREPLQQTTRSEEGVAGTRFVAKLDRVVVNWGPMTCASLWGGGQSLGMGPSPCGSALTLGRWCQK